MLFSEILQADSRGYCLTFWFHMYGPHIGTLNLYPNDRWVQSCCPQKDGWMDSWVGGWMDGLMDGYMNGRLIGLLIG